MVNTEEGAMEFWESCLESGRVDLFDGSVMPFASPMTNLRFLQRFSGKYPCFEFDPRKKQFYHNEACRFLSYIKDHTYLQIEEMFELAGAQDMEYNYSILGSEYKKLWEIYTGTR